MEMKMRINLKLDLGTYQIVCSECGYMLYGPEKGDQTEAALKAMELYPAGAICPSCGSKEVIMEINPTKEPNRYSKDHPYYPQRN